MQLKNPELLPLYTYFLLPLCGLNYKFFGTLVERIVLADNYRWFYVHTMTGLAPDLTTSEQVSFLQNVKLRDVYVVRVIPEFVPDVALIFEGKYSKVSEKAKVTIEQNSTLPYNETIGCYEVSHILLLALRNSPLLEDAFTHIDDEYIEREEIKRISDYPS